jgi:HlyD family secretion protein
MSDHLDHNRLQTDNLAEVRNAVATPPTLSDRVKSLRLANPQASRGSRFGWLPWVLCVVFLIVGAAAGLGSSSLLKFLPAQKAPAAPVESTKAESGDVVLENKGYIIPSRTYQVSPKVSGMVEKLYIQKEGDYFHKGDKLAILESVDYKADVDHTKSTLAIAEQRLAQLKKELPEEIKKAEYELEQAKSQLRQYVLDWERAQDLYHRQSIAKSDLDLAQANKEAKQSEVSKLTHAYRLVSGSADERIQAIEAEVAQDKADVRKAEWRLESCTIIAPSDGTILTKTVEEGNLANPIAFQAAVSASICTMADLSKLEVDISIQERDIKLVKEGQPCRVVAEGFPDRKPYIGMVLRKMPTADRAKGAIPVRVAIVALQADETPGEFLRPDVGVIVSFLKIDDKKKTEEKKADPQ